MNRNANSHFAVNPTNIDIPRSRFDRPTEIKLTLNAGQVIPFYWDEVLPGDTHQIRTNKVLRMQSLVTPVMDNIYVDTYYFFVPNRIVWEHWKEFMGENTQSAWIPQTEYVIPQITAPEGGWSIGSIADYMGVPTGVDGLSISALPFRAYSLIINEWFRDQNLLDPLNIPVDDSTVVGSNGDNYITDCAKGGKPFVAAKYFDYFTGALPSPQKGPAVSINITGDIPVVGNGYNLGLTNGSSFLSLGSASSTAFQNDEMARVASYGKKQGVYIDGDYGSSATAFGVPTLEQLGDNPEYSGLIVGGGNISVATINDLRTAFQIQKLFERDARGGTRYREILKSHFGVTSPDARMQVPEYLGGNRIPIMVNQVVQNSATAEGTTPQGNVAAYSLTSDSHGDFIKSFTEHGIIIGLMVIRYDHTYQQGLERAWSRKTRMDYYFPVLANLGEQAILNKEIYADGTAEDDEAFGYQERWAEYRYKPNRVCGEMRSSAPQSLDSWHLGDDYVSRPALSAEWIREDASNIDRVLAVSSDVSAQFFGDIYVQNTTTRPMPMYSIPGLIDHH